METLDEITKSVSNKTGFFNHVFNFNDDSKDEMMNIVQYAVLAIIPVIILNKATQRIIPEADEEKGTPEIAIEVNIPNQIRISLNKLSKNTYNAQRNDIMQQMNALPAEQYTEIAALIFEIASTNKFYSNIYADLYKELVDKKE